jgi:hypothetical protein
MRLSAGSCAITIWVFLYRLPGNSYYVALTKYSRVCAQIQGGQKPVCMLLWGMFYLETTVLYVNFELFPYQRMNTCSNNVCMNYSHQMNYLPIYVRWIKALFCCSLTMHRHDVWLNQSTCSDHIRAGERDFVVYFLICYGNWSSMFYLRDIVVEEGELHLCNCKNRRAVNRINSVSSVTTVSYRCQVVPLECAFLP